MFSNLYSSGFHLAEIVDFLDRSHLVDGRLVAKMREDLAQGRRFSEMMAGIGFSDTVTTQLSLAEHHGNIELSLEKIGAYLENMRKVKKKLIEVSTYPLLLVGFLILIMLGLRNYLLPQMDSQNIGTQLISQFPQIFLALVAGSGILVLLGVVYYRKSGKIKVFSALSHLPFGKGMIQAYLTAYYAREWGNMIGQGLELSQIFSMMQEQKSQLFQEIGVDLALSLDRGQSFSETVGHYPFFKKELPLMIEYGEVKSKLGSELEIYAEKTWEDFFRRVHKAMNVIQPLVFVFVALVIVLLYAAMLLPIYQNMEVHL